MRCSAIVCIDQFPHDHPEPTLAGSSSSTHELAAKMQASDLLSKRERFIP